MSEKQTKRQFLKWQYLILGGAVLILVAVTAANVGSFEFFRGYLRIQNSGSVPLVKAPSDISAVDNIMSPAVNLQLFNKIPALTEENRLANIDFNSKFDASKAGVLKFCSPAKYFPVNILVDTNSFILSDEEINSYISEASYELCSRTKVGIKAVKIQRFNFSFDQLYDKNQLAQVLIQNSDPDISAFVILTKQGIVGQYGGMADMIPADLLNMGLIYSNSFPDYMERTKLIYLLYVDFKHKFARCGYDTAGEKLISDVSSNGECQNQSNVKCVQHNGYSMCPGSINNYYAQTPTFFAVTSLLHEIMHIFGEQGNYDHVFDSTYCLYKQADAEDVLSFVNKPSGLDDDYWICICEYAWATFYRRANKISDRTAFPTLIEPMDHDQFNSSGANLFSWHYTINALSYSLYFYPNFNSASFGKVDKKICAGVYDNYCFVTYSTLKLEPGSYTWYVVANGTNPLAMISDKRTFTIVP